MTATKPRRHNGMPDYLPPGKPHAKRVRCPACQANEAERQPPELERPILPAGQMYVCCRACQVVSPFETAVWRRAQAGVAS